MSKQLRRWQRRCEYWLKRLALSHYTVVFGKEEGPQLREGQNTRSLPSDWQVVAATQVQPHYLKAYISINPESMKNWNDEEFDEHACHEVVHILLGPLDDWRKQVLETLPLKQAQTYDEWYHRANEQVTTHLTRLFMWGKNNGR